MPEDAEIGAGNVTASDRYHRAKRARHDHIAGMKFQPVGGQRVCEPSYRAIRIRAEHGRTGTGPDEFAVLLENRAERARVDAGRRRALLADDEARRRAVVGDRVDKSDLPVEDARVDDLERRHQRFGRGQDVEVGQPRTAQRAGQG